MEHIEPDTLTEYVDETLSVEELLRVVEHMAECEKCVQQAGRIQQATRLLDSWTPRSHGEAYAREASLESWFKRIAAVVAERVRVGLGSFRPQLPEFQYTGAGSEDARDDVFATVPALVDKGAEIIDASIDVMAMPRVSLSGVFVVGIRIRHDLGECEEKFDLYLVPQGAVIDEPIKFDDLIEPKRKRQYEASFALPEELQEHWREIENQPPGSWSFCFALRAHPRS